MRHVRRWQRVACWMAAGAAGGAAPPATRPAAVPPPGCTVVHRGSLPLSFGVDAVLVPIDPFKVRFVPQRYQGSLILRTAVPDGATIARGGSLLRVDTDAIDRQVAAAESTVAVARAGVTKAESDVALGERGDAVAMAAAKQSAADGDAGLKRYDQTDAPAAVATAGLAAQEVDAALDDATDELDQLRQMYKSEDLTNQTADIVLKRAVRQQALYQTMDRLAKVTADRASTFEPAVHRHHLAAAVASAALDADQLEAQQAQARVARAAALIAARSAAADADRALAELHHDRDALTVTSPVDGVVVYGTFADKAWQRLDAGRLAVGEKVQADQVLMTVYQPGRLAAVATAAQSQVRMLAPGTPVTVRTDALPEVAYAGTCGGGVPVSSSSKPDATVDVPVTLPVPVDVRLVPGYAARVDVDVPPDGDVLLVPATAVAHGRVCVRGSDGAIERRQVQLGRAGDHRVEIRGGLTDGDVVLSTYQD